MTHTVELCIICSTKKSIELYEGKVAAAKANGVSDELARAEARLSSLKSMLKHYPDCDLAADNIGELVFLQYVLACVVLSAACS